MAFLRIHTGAKSGTVLQIKEPTVTIGRGEKVTVRLPDEGASRQHAEIFRVGELYFIRDLNSRNGTFVNDRRITEVILRGEDQIRIGETVLLFLERQDSLQSRLLKIQDGAAGLDSFRFRDTMVSAKAQTKPLARKAPHKNVALRVAQIIADETSIQAIYDDVVREVAQAFEGDRADLFLVEAVEPEIQLRSLASYDTKREGEVAISRTIVKEAIDHRDAVLCSNAVMDERFGEAQSVLKHALKSVLCVPLMAAGSTLGVLYVSNSQQAEAFSTEDLDQALQVGLELGALLRMLKLAEDREKVFKNALLLSVHVAAGDAAPVPAALAVATHSRAIAQTLGLSPEEVIGAWVAGAIHDLAISDGGGGHGMAKAAADLPGLQPILDAVECQDERHDGSGKPHGKVGDEIPLLGRVLSFAKEIDRLVRQGGPDGKSMTLEQALASLRSAAGEKFQADIVQAAMVAHRNGIL